MRLRIVFLIDALLLVLMTALETVRFTGLFLHEWLGVGVTALIFGHLLLSWSWIAGTTRRLLSNPAPRARVNYAVNTGLFVSVVAVILSGFIVSEVVAPATGYESLVGDISWRLIHNWASDLVLICAGLHLAINWEWSVAAARKLFR